MLDRKFLLTGLIGVGLLAACTGALPPIQDTPPAVQVAAPGNGVPSPTQPWIALVDADAGSLALQASDGDIIDVFPPGSTVHAVDWSPDGAYLLVARTNTEPSPDRQGPLLNVPELWVVRVTADTVEPPTRLFQPDADEIAERGLGMRSTYTFGRWSPDGRHLLVWVGPDAAGRADGNAPWVIAVPGGEAIAPAEWSLVNQRYYSWSPDGSTLAITVGGRRSGQDHKWLNLVDVDTGAVTTVISSTEQVPGIVAWSPNGDVIAYAAVNADLTSDDACCPINFTNPAIAARRVYLLDPQTDETRRLNDIDAYQDTPVWSEDEATLYYVQWEPDTETIVLMAADPVTGAAQPLDASRQPAPVDTLVGYYGQSDWEALLDALP